MNLTFNRLGQVGISATAFLLALGAMTPAQAIVFSSDARQALSDAGIALDEPFRLVFTTSSTRDAQADDIATYDTFVNDVAASSTILQNALDALVADGLVGFGGNITWSAIAATEDDNLVRVNTNTQTTDPSFPILDLQGDLIADGNNDLWDGAINSPIDITENNDPINVSVWTGVFNADGTPGSNRLGLNFPRLGSSNATNATWITENGAQPTNEFSLYAISDPIVAVPFHTDVLPGLVALGGFAFWRVRRQHQLRKDV